MIGTALLALQLAAVSPAAPARPPLTERRTVVVDAGHGGPDRGMTGPIGASRPLLIEKDVTLSVAKRVAAVLERRGMRVIMTRTTDTLIALADRGHIANEAGGDVFLSIHVNAANPRWKNASAARGYETYFLADAKTEDARRVAELENASERFEAVQDTRKGDPLRFILTDMQQNEHLRESSELAAIVQRHLGRVQHGPSRGVKQAGFKVLVTAFMPAVLVEIGFGTNPAEARVLRDGDEQQRIAESIADATEEYLRRLEPRGDPAPR
jgi:N-acetylmuramoyl-L-alanine amidase